jgi:DUF4097 and DUF4098 domain-containing protein YvlB
MSKGEGEFQFNIDKKAKIKILSGDIEITQSDDEKIHFHTDDSYFYMKSHEDDNNVFVEVGRLNPLNGSIRGFEDLEIVVPVNSKIGIDLLNGDIDCSNINLKDFSVSLKHGDIDVKGTECENLDIECINGDMDLDLNCDYIDLKNVNGDTEISIHKDFYNANLKTVKGDIFVKLDVEPKFIQVSKVHGDCFINGKEITSVTGNGQAEVKIKNVNGDVNVLYSEKTNNVSVEKDSEIKKVLQMLKDKKITKEQAEELLDSLKNKEVF